MQHLIPYLPALAMTGTSLRHAPIVLATEANAMFAHEVFGRTTAHGVALDFEFAGFRK